MSADSAPDFLHVALSATARHAPSASRRLRALAYLKARLEAGRKSSGADSAAPAPEVDSAIARRSDLTSRFN